ncbi:MAG TPA: hypothetical protein VG708_02025 [Mycobacteriales bacterium]|jgi:hypothetical protein|nr:hypothetical protein [Mycobacteriales bacterium]
MGSIRITRLPAPSADPSLLGQIFDYSDAFDVRVPRPDSRTAEQWARCALEQAPTPMRRAVLLIHRRVLRLRLEPVGRPDNVLGWHVRSSQPDQIELEASGPLMRAVIIGRRTAPVATEVRTFVFYRRRLAAAVWALVGPLHRRVAPYLLKRGARSA